MVSPGTDVLWLVAEFLSPNPILYCKLALINRDFYQVFTSDKLWAALNPYGAQKDIIATFYAACNRSPSEYGLLSLVWWRCVDLDPSTIREFTDNRFVWLGFLTHCCSKRSWHGFEKYPQLIKNVIDLEPTQYLWTSDSIRNVFEYTLHAVKASGANFAWVPEEFEFEESLLIPAIKDGFIRPLEGYDFDLDLFKEDIRAAFEKDKDSIIWVIEDVMGLFGDDRDMILKIIAHHPWVILEARRYRNDYEVCLQAVTAKSYHPMLEHCPAHLQDDDNLVMAAVKCSGSNILHASPRLRAKHEYIFEAIKSWYLPTKERIYDVFEILTRQELELPDLMEALVSRSGALLSELPAGHDLHAVVLAAVSNHGRSIRFASQRLRGDKELALVAIRQTHNAYTFISADLKDDRDILEAVVKKNGAFLAIIPSELRDLALVQLAVSSNGLALEFAPNFQDDRRIVESAVRQIFWALDYTSDRLKKDREVLGIAFAKCPYEHERIPEELRRDRAFMRPIIERNGTCLPELLEDREYALLSVTADATLYEHLPRVYKEDLEFNIEAVRGNGLVFNKLVGHALCYNKRLQAEIK